MDAVSENAALKNRRNTMELENNNFLPNFLITAASTQGGRRYMEDRLQIEVGRNADGQLDFVYTAVYDGHGGPQASEYVRQHLFNNIVDNPSFSSDDDHVVLEAIREGFLKTHSEMRQEAMQWPPTVSGFPCTAGTTATCAFIRNGKLYTGHVGDSTMFWQILQRRTPDMNKDAKLTDDHKPDIKTERQRIERAGGAVAMKSGIFRVIWKRPMRGHRGPVRRSTATENIPFLAVARSLGDFWSLNPISNEYIVSPEPDVDVFELKHTDDFVVMATDGLTTVVGVRAIIEALREAEQRSKHFTCNGNESPSVDENNCDQLIDIDQFDVDLPLNQAQCLLQYAFKRWSTLRADNISIICVKLNANEVPTDRNIVVNDEQSLNVCEAIAEQPMAMLVTDNGTQLLRTNAVRLQYLGAMDKCVKTSSQNRSAAPTADNGPVVAQDICHDVVDGTMDKCVEPPALNHCGVPSADNGSTALVICHNGQDNRNEDATPAIAKPPPPSPMAQSRKRRLRDDEEDEVGEEVVTCKQSRLTQQFATRRFRFDECTSSSTTATITTSTRVSLEGDECEVGTFAAASVTAAATKPPPAKRLRIQSVFNFITSLFGFRWPG
ncbi:hypothetical protein niasHT_004865 [Heterodera trifolii]|uniref:PPM-type phosphatase domain-containing protein n=1 Tax=Heterodera trifolii TaxID=157864 RepID=A0ABD2LT59_9BILA